eukprot:jgi/Chlat1/3271/Chrsp22S03444
MVDGLSELEAQRKARIEANKHKLLELNLAQHASALRQTTPRKRPTQPKTPASAPVGSRRLSDRVRNITPVSCNLEKIYRMSRFARTGRLTRSDRKECEAAELASLRNGKAKMAHEAAEELEAASPYPGVVRGATGDKHQIYLRLKNRPDLPLWDIVYLSRPGGSGGLSGGWRGFAIDLELRVGDAVLFEKPMEDTWVYEVTVVRAGEREADEINTENIRILMQQAGLEDGDNSSEEDTDDQVEDARLKPKPKQSTVEEELLRVKTPQVADLPRTKRGKRVVPDDEQPAVVVKTDTDEILAALDDIEPSAAVMAAFQSALAHEDDCPGKHLLFSLSDFAQPYQLVNASRYASTLELSAHSSLPVPPGDDLDDAVINMFEAALAGGNSNEDAVPNLAEEKERKRSVSLALSTGLQKQVASFNTLGATLATMGAQAEGTKLRIFSATLNTWLNGIIIRYTASDISHEIHFEDNTIVTCQLWDLRDDELALIEGQPAVAGQLRLTDYYKTVKASQATGSAKAER